MNKTQKIVRFLMMGTAGLMLAYIIANIAEILWQTAAASFPWYSPILYGAMFFGPFLLAEWIIYRRAGHKDRLTQQ